MPQRSEDPRGLPRRLKTWLNTAACIALAVSVMGASAVVNGRVNKLTGGVRGPVYGSVVSAALGPGDVYLDFQNGAYRKDGVVDTFSSIGGSLAGGAVVTPGVGLLCTNTGDIATISYNIPAGDFALVLRAAGNTNGGGFAYLYKNGNSTLYARYAAGDYRYGYDNSVGGGSQVAMGGAAFNKFVLARVGTNLRWSSAGGAVSSTAITGTIDLTSGAVLAMCNNEAGSSPYGDAIQAVVIHKGTFSDAQLSALSAP